MPFTVFNCLATLELDLEQEKNNLLNKVGCLPYMFWLFECYTRVLFKGDLESDVLFWHEMNINYGSRIRHVAFVSVIWIDRV